MKKALLLALAALMAAPLTFDSAPAEAHPPRGGWYRPAPVRYRPYWGPVYRPRRPVVVVAPAPIYPPPVVYVEPPPPRVIVREVPAPTRVAVAPEPAPAPTVMAEPEPVEPEGRDFLGVGIRVSGASVEGEKVGMSTAENPSMGGIGLQLRGRFSDSFGLELSVDFLEGSDEDGDLSQSTIPLMAAVTYHFFPTMRLQPYVLAGAGVHFTRLEYFGGDYAIDMTELAGQFGGGLEIFITENLAIHADIRAQTIFKSLDTEEKIAQDCERQIGSQTGFCDNIHFTGADDKVDLGVQLQAGVSWYF
ncbi:MAG: porin family protein [Deltaproteobacteria bacterium]|nr:porin family protein [Deltaproteobacteria bacterium]